MPALLTPTLLGLITTGMLTGCSPVGPDFTPPKPPVEMIVINTAPGSEHARQESKPVFAPLDPHWWESFQDPELTALVKRAASGNLDIRTAAARLAQSRAQRGVTAADAYPKLNANASATGELLSSKGAVSLLTSGDPATQANGTGATSGAFPSHTSIPPFSLYQTGFDVSWELDLWGRVRREVESADASVQAAENDRHAVMLSTVAEVARDYIQLRGTQTTLRIVRDNLATARETLGLTRSRAQAGLSSDLDIAQAEAQTEETAAELPQLEQQEAQGINQLGLLLGLGPQALQAELATPKPVPPVPPQVPLGLPTELAERRPDVREAEARLHSATADIGVAKADFFPRVTFSGSAALQAIQFHDLGSLSAGTYGIGPSITLPIFDGGRIRRTVDLRTAQQQEAAIAYQRAVLQAFTDVDNALIAYSREQDRHDHLAAQVAQSDRALALARDRYRQGLADYLVVLTAQRTALAAEQELAASTVIISTNLVTLYKALGGGWDA